MIENTPAASASSAGESAPQPLLWHNGVAYTQQSADAKRTELMKNADYVRAALDGDTGKAKELADLYMLARGHVPAPPQDAPDVLQQMQNRAQTAAEQHAAALRSHADFTDGQVHQIVGQRPILADERQWHINQLNRLKQDKEFVRRYLDGDRDAGLKMRLHTAGSVLPIGTLAEIERWEAAHPMPK